MTVSRANSPEPMSIQDLNRRDFLSYFSSVDLADTLLPGGLWARFQETREITPAVLAEAEKVAGLDFTEEEREAMVRGLNQNRQAYEALRAQTIPNEILPALPVPIERSPYHPECGVGGGLRRPDR